MKDRKFKFFRVEQAEHDPRYYRIFNKTPGDLLGNISYFARWDEFVFEPHPNSLWSSDQLRDIITYLNELNKEAK
jgi:hypothetical protein